jgi:hypothetical protein
MVEIIKHLFGCCGEAHPSIFYIFLAVPLFFKSIFTMCYKGVVLIVKNYLG